MTTEEDFIEMEKIRWSIEAKLTKVEGILEEMRKDFSKYVRLHNDITNKLVIGRYK